MRTRSQSGHPSPNSRIAAERAEIQRLIARLQRSRGGAGGSGDGREMGTGQRGSRSAPPSLGGAAAATGATRAHAGALGRDLRSPPVARLDGALEGRRLAGAPLPTRADGGAQAHLDAWNDELEALRELRRSLEADPPLARLEAQLATVVEQLRVVSERLARGSVRPRASKPPPADTGTHILAGSIAHDLLSDILQLVSSNSLSGVFVVESEGSTVRLYFEEGNICHAEGPNAAGESAFYMAFAFESGRYWFDPPAGDPPARTISSGTQFLILEALRRIDESHAE